MKENSRQKTACLPVGQLGTKRMGELAELAFMYRAASYGFGVARPYGDSHQYDFLVQHGRRLLRVQVKSCFTPQEGYRRAGYPIIVSRAIGKSWKRYSIEDIDFIAAFVAPHEAWYVIPIEALGTSKNIRLYPAGKHNKRSGAWFEHYREAWHLLQEEETEEPR